MATIEEELESRGYTFEEDTRYCGAGKYYDFNHIKKEGMDLGDISVLVPTDDDKPVEYMATISEWFEKSSSSKGMFTVESTDKSEEACLNDMLKCISWLESNKDMILTEHPELSMEDENEMLGAISDVNGEEADLSDLYESVFTEAEKL